MVSVSLDFNMSIDDECALCMLSIVSSLDESRDVVFYEIIPFLHDSRVNLRQGECITEITWADGLPLLPHAFLISLHKGKHPL